MHYPESPKVTKTLRDPKDPKTQFFEIQEDKCPQSTTPVSKCKQTSQYLLELINVSVWISYQQSDSACSNQIKDVSKAWNCFGNEQENDDTDGTEQATLPIEI